MHNLIKSNLATRVFSRLRQHPAWCYLDRQLFNVLLTVALPITLQTIMLTSKGVIDVLMLGQLSEYDVAGAGIATRILFVFTILLSGVAIGGATLAAQHFGAKHQQGIKQSIQLSWVITTLVALCSIVFVSVLGHHVIHLTTRESDVFNVSHNYLLYAAPSLLFIAYQVSVAAGLRSMHQASTITLFSGIGIVLNISFNWVLIFGLFGLPALGATGAAIGTTLATLLESILLALYLGHKKHLLSCLYQSARQTLNWQQYRHFLSIALPTTINFLLWALGVFAYTAIMAQTGTSALAVLSIISPIEAFSLSLLVGIANASAVVVGNNLGAQDPQRAYYQAMYFALFAVIATLLVSLLLYFNLDTILNLFGGLSPDTIELARAFFVILCIGILVRSIPTVMVVGVLRAGGDVKFCLYQDLISQWVLGIPVAAICALWLKLPAEYVFASFFLEAIVKWAACLYRFKSRKWMNNLAH
ncbi:MATE family efflux transporter [Vibrio scophthalmi]|uniref:MATE family efflux transporter n=1 Tax=Vibrio scophthalmi TaxID=45658 RepID=UPI003AAA45B4